MWCRRELGREHFSRLCIAADSGIQIGRRYSGNRFWHGVELHFCSLCCLQGQSVRESQLDCAVCNAAVGEELAKELRTQWKIENAGKNAGVVVMTGICRKAEIQADEGGRDSRCQKYVMQFCGKQVTDTCTL